MVFRVVATFAIMHVGRVLFREQDLGMIWQHLTLNPFAATLVDWRVGCALALEAALYGLPLTLLYPLLEKFHLIPSHQEDKMQTWGWTCLQGAAGALIMLGLLTLRSTEGGSFIYFQF